MYVDVYGWVSPYKPQAGEVCERSLPARAIILNDLTWCTKGKLKFLQSGLDRQNVCCSGQLRRLDAYLARAKARATGGLQPRLLDVRDF